MDRFVDPDLFARRYVDACCERLFLPVHGSTFDGDLTSTEQDRLHFSSS